MFPHHDTSFHYKLRGEGSWLPSRGGMDDNLDLGFLDLPRGAGFFSNLGSRLRDSLRSAWQGAKKILIPRLKSEGPALARKIAEYGASKASEYITKSNRLGPVTGLINQALLDLPNVVTDIITKKIDDGEIDLSDQERQFIATNSSRGGSLDFIAQQMIFDSMPYIEDAANILRTKFKLIDQFASDVQRGIVNRDKLKEFHKFVTRSKDELANEDDYAKWFFSELLELMIITSLEYADKQNLILEGSRLHSFMKNGANRLTEKLAESYDTADLLKSKRMALMYPHSPLCTGLCTLKESPIDLELDRGGFIGAATLAGSIIPALIGLIPTITGAISDWKRGSGYNIDTSDLTPTIIKAIQSHAPHQKKGIPKRSPPCSTVALVTKRRRK